MDVIVEMDERPKILVVDDEVGIRRLIKMYLEQENFVVEEARDGNESLNRALKTDYDVILLDLMLPETDGIHVAKKLRKEKNTPIIMITAKSEESSRLQAFEVGADDYIVKPFSPRELVLRVKALLRRVTNPKYKETEKPAKNLLIYPHLTINYDTRQVTVDGFDINITPKEFEVLCFLAERPDKVFSQLVLIKEIWGYDSATDIRLLYTQVKRLRDKLNSVSSSAGGMIATVRGVGYKFKVDDDYWLEN